MERTVMTRTTTAVDDSTLRFRWMGTRYGRLLVAGDRQGLRSIAFTREGRRTAPEADWIEDDGVLQGAIDQLTAYFAGGLQEFDLSLTPRGTEFQIAVWEAVAAIPYGTTTSYGQVAAEIGRPTAVRAVGAANGANPVPIVIPCHRVIGSNGKLTGYGGGLDLKASLLELESSIVSPSLFQR
jgi:methylated-DNA-[protein]-cysteine S-methyltransferase